MHIEDSGGGGVKFLSFGEIIFDQFLSGAELGGAPLNVAVHLARFGAKSYLVSAIGADELGKRALSEISATDVDTKYIGLSSRETGRADVVLDENGMAKYVFNSPAAWDEIELFPQEYKTIFNDNWDGVVFGTLAQRSGITRLTLEKLLDGINAREILFDVNLRKPFYSKEEIETSLSYATILKLNDEELSIISDMLGIKESSFEKKILSKYPKLRGILVTHGPYGISYKERGKDYFAKAQETKVVDTVGAGDSVSAAFLYFLSKTKDPNLALERASIIASYVVSTKGAIAPYSTQLKMELGI